mmetsp:Transcript_5672/g.13672  ORF Transcript_5672/g.13672 Transcript_5672/m.13672 type:complete len:497 (-) Transcript_5672:26-1516(-)
MVQDSRYLERAIVHRERVVWEITNISGPLDVLRELRELAARRIPEHERKHLLKKLERRAWDLLTRFSPLDLSRTLVHYGAMGLRPGQAMLQGMERQVLARMGSYNAAAISMTFHAFGKMGAVIGDYELFEGLEKKAVSLIHTFTRNQIVTTLAGFADLGQEPGERLMDGLQHRALDTMKDFSCDQIGSMMRAFATLTVTPEVLLPMPPRSALRLDTPGVLLGCPGRLTGARGPAEAAPGSDARQGAGHHWYLHRRGAVQDPIGLRNDAAAPWGETDGVCQGACLRHDVGPVAARAVRVHVVVCHPARAAGRQADAGCEGARLQHDGGFRGAGGGDAAVGDGDAQREARAHAYDVNQREGWVHSCAAAGEAPEQGLVGLRQPQGAAGGRAAGHPPQPRVFGDERVRGGGPGRDTVGVCDHWEVPRREDASLHQRQGEDVCRELPSTRGESDCVGVWEAREGPGREAVGGPVRGDCEVRVGNDREGGQQLPLGACEAR